MVGVLGFPLVGNDECNKCNACGVSACGASACGCDDKCGCGEKKGWFGGAWNGLWNKGCENSCGCDHKCHGNKWGNFFKGLD
jgi:hypothetical protein